MYIGRLFFRKDTGNLVYWYEMEGNIVAPTIEQDLLTLKPLKDYNPETIEVVELEEADTDTRERCRLASGINLDLVTKEMIFNFTQEVIEQISLEERVNELETLVLQLSGVI